MSEEAPSPLDHRRCTLELTPEFLQEIVDGDDEPAVEAAVRRFEDSYNAVAWAQENKFDYGYSGETGYTVRAIAAKSADPDAISRGMQSIMHWLTEMEDND